MCYKIILDLLTAIGTVGAIIIGMAAIYHSNMNSKREIKTHKLEEIFQLIQSLNRYYGKFKELYFCIEDLRDRENQTIQTLSDYYEVRDEKLPFVDRQKLILDLSRLEVLSKCYTKSTLFNELLKYEDLMFAFSDFVFNGGSMQQELKWKNGFPDHEEYFALVEGLKAQIIVQIKKK